MRALPLTDTSRPGGRPRQKRAPHNAFAGWLSSCGKTAASVAGMLGIGRSSVYNLRNGFYTPGRELALKICKISKGAVPIDSWKVRTDLAPRRKRAKATAG